MLQMQSKDFLFVNKVLWDVTYNYAGKYFR